MPVLVDPLDPVRPLNRPHLSDLARLANQGTRSYPMDLVRLCGHVVHQPQVGRLRIDTYCYLYCKTDCYHSTVDLVVLEVQLHLLILLYHWLLVDQIFLVLRNCLVLPWVQQRPGYQ